MTAFAQISRAAAVARVVTERGPGCLVCELVAGRAGAGEVLERGARATALLARYALRPGHALVLAHDCTRAVGDLDEDAWLELAAMARRAARAIDAVLTPARCYVASLGTTADVPMSSPHVHLHVVPVGADERPSTVLTWARGVSIVEGAAASDLAARLRAAWPT